MDLIVRDLEDLESSQGHVAARGDDGAHVAAALLHETRGGDDDVVPTRLELANELHILLDGSDGRHVTRRSGRRHEHIIEREAEAALWTLSQRLTRAHLVHELLQLLGRAALRTLLCSLRHERVPVGDHQVDDVRQEEFGGEPLRCIEHFLDEGAHERAARETVCADVGQVRDSLLLAHLCHVLPILAQPQVRIERRRATVDEVRTHALSRG